MDGKLTLLLFTSALALSLTACSTIDTSKPSDSIQLACPAPSDEDRNIITQARADALIEMSESKAEACAQSLGWGFRIGSRDGEEFMLTQDFSTSRVTVRIKNDSIFEVIVG